MADKKIENLYHMASEYMMDNEDFSAYEIISYACEALSDYPQFETLYGKCVNHINMWNDASIKDYMLVEEISGSLGEYFCD